MILDVHYLHKSLVGVSSKKKMKSQFKITADEFDESQFVRSVYLSRMVYWTI